MLPAGLSGYGGFSSRVRRRRKRRGEDADPRKEIRAGAFLMRPVALSPAVYAGSNGHLRGRLEGVARVGIVLKKKCDWPMTILIVSGLIVCVLAIFLGYG